MLAAAVCTGNNVSERLSMTDASDALRRLQLGFLSILRARVKM